jgi:phosphoribosylglycinamide formyltransferase, formyltetrahydrofolate-dependent
MKKHAIAIFASGYGSNFEAIADACADGRIDAEVKLLVCDNPFARVCELAGKRGIDSFIFSPKSFLSKEAFETEIVDRCREKDIELICLAGYMRIVGDTLLDEYRDRIINIHPSLLPSFKGANAIEQALEYGVKVFGVTIHYVDESLDGGRIVAQRAFPYEGDDVEELTAMTHAVEHPLYIETIQKLLSDK